MNSHRYNNLVKVYSVIYSDSETWNLPRKDEIGLNGVEEKSCYNSLSSL